VAEEGKKCVLFSEATRFSYSFSVKGSGFG